MGNTLTGESQLSRRGLPSLPVRQPELAVGHVRRAAGCTTGASNHRRGPLMSDIKVKVIEYADRQHYLLCFKCPLSGRRKFRSSKVERTGRKRERDAAERAAADWERELRDGTYLPPTRVSWADFRDRYEQEVLPGLAEKTGAMVGTVFNAVERILAPAKLVELTAERLSYFQAELRAGKRSEATIRSYTAHLKSALRWAVDIGLLKSVPKVQRLQRARGGKLMKGRPITAEEFDRMLDKVSAVVGDVAAPLWAFYLRGLFLSGLRLAESLELYWDRDDKLCVDLTGKRPMLRILAALEKGNQNRLLPLAPEFAELLLSVPIADRKGRVFQLADRAGKPREFTAEWVGRVVSEIGERAGVKVNTDPRSGKVKYASAHDLRRSFGERWAARLMPQQLMELMRHESIETTMRFYVGRNAQTTADLLWAAHEREAKSAATNFRQQKARRTGFE